MHAEQRKLIPAHFLASVYTVTLIGSPAGLDGRPIRNTRLIMLMLVPSLMVADHTVSSVFVSIRDNLKGGGCSKKASK